MSKYQAWQNSATAWGNRNNSGRRGWRRSPSHGCHPSTIPTRWLLPESNKRCRAHHATEHHDRAVDRATCPTESSDTCDFARHSVCPGRLACRSTGIAGLGRPPIHESYGGAMKSAYCFLFRHPPNITADFVVHSPCQSSFSPGIPVFFELYRHRPNRAQRTRAHESERIR